MKGDGTPLSGVTPLFRCAPGRLAASFPQLVPAAQYPQTKYAHSGEKGENHHKAPDRIGIGYAQKTVPEAVYHVKKGIVIGYRFPEGWKGMNGEKDPA